MLMKCRLNNFSQNDTLKLDCKCMIKNQYNIRLKYFYKACTIIEIMTMNGS